MDVKAIGEKIKKRRTVLGMTQKQLAQALNISNQLVSKWETGESVPSLEYLDCLCRALNVGYSYFTDEWEADGAPQDNAAEPVQPPPENNAPAASVAARKFNLKLFLIIFCSIFGALVIATTTLLTYYVFVPAANKNRYLGAIDRADAKYFDLGYYSINLKTEVDGDVREDYTYQGYFEANGSVAYYNSRTGQTVAGGILTYDYDDQYKYTYVPVGNSGTLEDFAVSQAFPGGEEDDGLGLENIRYIRKVKGGYYLEMRDEYFTDGLTGTQKKNYKILGKIKGRVDVTDGLLRYMSVTVKYLDKPNNEEFTVKVIAEFDVERPQIEHKNLEGRELYKDPVYEEPEYPDDKLPVCENKVDTETVMSFLTDGAAQKAAIDDGDDELVMALLDGMFYKRTSDGIALINPDNPSEQWLVKIDSDDFSDVYIYGDKLYYGIYSGSYSQTHTFYVQDIKTGAAEKLFAFDTQSGGNDKINYNGRYVYFLIPSLYSDNYIVYDLVGKRQICNLSDMWVEYVDYSGNVYGISRLSKYSNSPVVYRSGQQTLLEGNYFYRINNEEYRGDTVYTADSRWVYEYEKGVYKTKYTRADMRFREGYRDLGGCYCIAGSSSFDRNIYNADGSIKGAFSTVILQDGDTKVRAVFHTVLETFGDKMLVQLSGAAGDEYNYYYAVYSVHDLTKPLCFTDKSADYPLIFALSEFTVKRAGGKQIIGIRNSPDFAYAYDIYIV